MEKIISCCGINCASCDARIATINGDNELKKKTAENWRVTYNAPHITDEMINCTGCREEGTKFAHCSKCEIRNCADGKGYKTCDECSEIESCKTLSFVLTNVPGTLENLKSLI